MNREDRHFVHELAGHYGVTSEAQDPEPNRSVVVRFNGVETQGTCCPYLLIVPLYL